MSQVVRAAAVFLCIGLVFSAKLQQNLIWTYLVTVKRGDSVIFAIELKIPCCEHMVITLEYITAIDWYPQGKIQNL